LDYKSLFRYRKKHLKKILQIGVPSAGEQLSYNASQMVITYFVAQLGTIAITTKVYAQNIMMFIFLFSIAIGQGTQIMIRQMSRACEHDEAYVRGLISLRISLIVSLSMAGLVIVFAKPLLAIFTDDLTTIKLGALLLFMTIILEPGPAFNLVM